MNNGATYQETLWSPETPFLQDVSPARETAPTAPVPSFGLESPFLSEHGYDGSVVATPRSEAFGQLLEELRDEEFESAVAGLIDQASALSEGPAYEGEQTADQRARQERTARAFLDEVAAEAEAMLDRLTEASESKDLGAMSEAALDEYLEGLAPAEGSQGPLAEEFIKKLFKKATKAVKGAVALAKKGIKLAGNLLPHVIVLRKIRPLIRPLMLRVLRAAVDKLPVTLQPIARRLAARVLGAGEAEQEEEESEGAEAASIDPREVAAEFDTMVAGTVTGGESFEQQMAIESLVTVDGNRDAIRELDRARATLADRLTSLDGEEAAPAVEQFVPVALGALKIGIKILGRPRVVRFIASILAQLIQRHVGRDNAVKLSRALVDAGLKLASLEAESQESVQAAGETLAATVQESIERLTQAMPADAWENETILEAYAREAFEQAVAANFPDDTVRTELHEANEVKGVWARRRGLPYKKYSRVPSVVLPARVARAIPTFRGQRLDAILRDRFGIVGPVRVNVHLYETVAGTTAGTITRGEQDATAGAPAVPGAAAAGGTAGAAAGQEGFLHPLTEETAGLLLREPGLGRDVEARYLESPHKLAMGQRLYHLEVADRSARPRGTRPRRLRVSVNLPKGEVRVAIYLSEATAQEIAKAFRKKARPGVILNLLRRAFEPRVHAVAEAEDAVRVVGEVAAEDPEVTTRRVRRRLGRRLRRLALGGLVRALGAELDRRYQALAAEFDKAANADVDGLTVKVTLSGVPWLPLVRQAAARTAVGREAEVTGPGAPVSAQSVSIVPGYQP
jgi:hypothetical protein